MKEMLYILVSALLVGVLVLEVKGHGRLVDPPARSTMWREGFQNVPVHYNDNELFCGGFEKQWEDHGGKCGVCGDEYGGPYDHEKGGKYYTDVIAKHYKEGQEFTAVVELTAAHMGWFEFRLCIPENNEDSTSHDCLNKNLLHLADGSTRYKVISGDHAFHKIRLQLPAGETCDYCVLQWKYHTGNSWGVDPDGRGCIGCGAQEEFYGCANIAIDPSDGSTKPKPPPEVKPPPPGEKPGNPEPKPKEPASGGCRAAEGPWKTSGMDKWCVTNCAVGNCPPSHCVCDGEGKVAEKRENPQAVLKKASLLAALRHMLEENKR